MNISIRIKSFTDINKSNYCSVKNKKTVLFKKKKKENLFLAMKYHWFMYFIQVTIYNFKSKSMIIVNC